MKYPNLLSMISCVIIVFTMITYYQILGHDNVSVIYRDMTTGPDIYGHLYSYRYSMVIINYFLKYINFGYYDFIYTWIAIFSIGLVFMIHEFTRYLELSPRMFPFILLSVGLHGYMTDVYIFSMVFTGYGLSMIGAGLSLTLLRRRQWAWLAPLGVFLSLISYQPFVLVLPCAVGLRIIKRFLSGENNYRIFWDVFRFIAIFISGIIIFIIIYYAIGSSSGRANGITIQKILDYVSFIPRPFVSKWNYYAPLHERVIYGMAIASVGIWVVIFAVKEKTAKALGALAVMAALIMMMPDPFNLLGRIFWPAPRTLIFSIFLQVGCLAILYNLIPTGIQQPVGIAGIVFLLMSGLNQIAYYGLQREQMGRDASAVQMIVSDIKKMTKVTPQTKLAVKSTWRNFAHKPQGLSAFDTPWSNAAIFRVLTGNFVQAPVPKGACAEPVTDFWRIEKVGDVIVVCMK